MPDPDAHGETPASCVTRTGRYGLDVTESGDAQGQQTVDAPAPSAARSVRDWSAAVRSWAGPGVYARSVRAVRPWVSRGAPIIWFLAGGMVGAATAQIAFWSWPWRLGAALVLGIVTVIARGLARVVVIAVAALGLVALIETVVITVRPDLSWSFAAVVALAVLIVATSLWTVRRSGSPVVDHGGFRPLLDLCASATALLWSIWFAHQVSKIGLSNVLSVFITSEDNAAWVNTLGQMTLSGSIEIGRTAFDAYGPVIGTLLGFARLGVDLARLGVSGGAANLLALLTSFGWLVMATPLVAVVISGRVCREGRFLRALLTWVVVTVVLASQVGVLVLYGFVSASVVTLVLVVLIAMVDDVRASVRGWRPLVTWSAVVFVLLVLGASWFPLIPLGVVAIVLWFIGSSVDALLRGRPAWPQWVLSAIVAGVAIDVLYQQGKRALDCCGGADNLASAMGGTPDASPVVLALALALLALGWVALPIGGGSVATTSRLVGSLLILGFYTVLVILVEAARTSGGAHYGGRKLTFIVVGVALGVLLVHLMQSQTVTGRPMQAAYALGLAVLVAVSAQTGPAFVALQGHWPTALAEPAWAAAVTQAVASGDRVACLSTHADAPAEGNASFDAYLCSRWAQSLAGMDGPAAGVWRFALLGRVPVATALPFAQAPGSRPLTLFVIGPTDELTVPTHWWAPLIAGANIKVVPVPG